MAESLSTRLTKGWFEGAFWPRLLLPLTALFAIVYVCRKLLYLHGIKKSYPNKIPVIVVGNITVGGTGKSPLVANIVKDLQTLGLSPGIVSRGYGAEEKIREPVVVNETSQAGQVGDEPLMLFQMTGVPVAVCPERRKAVSKLVDLNCDIAIADDGLQHLAMSRDVELCVVDAQRLWGNRLMLPAGPLREPLSRLWHTDFIVLNGMADAPATEKFEKNLKLARDRRLDPSLYRMQLKPGTISSLDGKTKMSLGDLGAQEVYACAGIGSPSRFFHTLVELGVVFEPKPFPDHHVFTIEDFDMARGRLILMTQKDAVKCRHLGLSNAWYLPVEAQLDKPLANDIVHRLVELGKLSMRNID